MHWLEPASKREPAIWSVMGLPEYWSSSLSVISPVAADRYSWVPRRPSGFETTSLRDQASGGDYVLFGLPPRLPTVRFAVPRPIASGVA